MKTIQPVSSFWLVLGIWLVFGSQVHAENFVTVQPIQVCQDDGENCAQTGFFDQEVDKIWSQADIQVHFLPTKRLHETDFLHIDASSPGPEEDFILFGNAPHHGQHENPNVINMWFVDELLSFANINRNGVACGPAFGVCGELTGVIISRDVFGFNSGNGRRDTIPHEIGHVLGLGHRNLGSGVPENLMSAREDRRVPLSLNSIAPDGEGLSRLTSEQIAVVLDSRFVLPASVPEPSGTALVAQCMLALSILVRRRGMGKCATLGHFHEHRCS